MKNSEKTKTKTPSKGNNRQDDAKTSKTANPQKDQQNKKPGTMNHKPEMEDETEDYTNDTPEDGVGEFDESDMRNTADEDETENQ
jgi:hypothetical protein